MKSDKKGIDKPVDKEKSVLSTGLLGIVRKFKPVMLPESIRVHRFDPVDYQTRRLTQDTLLNAEHRKAKALTLIRRATII